MVATLVVALLLLCLAAGTEASPELSGYLRKVLRNHTVHTCDGEQLLILCPRKTTISILGAFYGRRVPSPNLCPSPGNVSQESTECMSPTAHLKLLAECQDQQWCQFSVHSQVFGPDPCPGTHKYLIASYKCRPDNHRVKTVCENNELRLHCRPKSVLAIYSAHYGRFLRGKPECDAPNAGGPHIECLAPDALRRVSKKCHRKGNCTVTADQATFGDPCLPGTRKQLRVSYTCVPKQLLEEVGPDTSDPFLLSNYMHGGWYKGPRFSRLREDRMIFTSSLAAFAQLWGTWPQSAGLAGDLQAQAPCVLQRGVHPDASLCSSPPPDVPEKVALYFLCGVSAGLALLLCIVSPKAGFLREAREALLGPGGRSEASRTKLRDEQDEDLPDDSSSDSSFRRLTRAYRATDSIFGPELTAAMEGAAEQQGRGGEEIWMPKEASPYTIQKIKSATK
ncbi:protein eva-1 homolog C isoform X7 [Gallus gallus]|uniref:protein eva-1 homolog C isoform X7 n=1 Tax=Gallus gallus TaxID=9031 RepID=UPI000350757B|nr:protein eva-1 homolog C isoform X7 [Gallus gallus]XP_040525383.1 protein eva-1 homolog C isoform X7 [Gallus gallus]|eukprot:XP_025006098.1 protein eva-1 homolog C isoform X6 [Gallus gallus]